jgi:hypothetical protein
LVILANGQLGERGGGGIAYLSGDVSIRQKLERMRGQMELARVSFDSHWRELGEYFSPQRIRFYSQGRTDRGKKSQGRIIDSTGQQSLRTLVSGLMTGISSPARPWIRLTVSDPFLAEQGDVRAWLDEVTRIILWILSRSNFYQQIPILYGDVGLFGTGAVFIEEDFSRVIFCSTFPMGSYWLGNDSMGRVRVFYRRDQMTVRQIVEEFGRGGGRRREVDWSNISTHVRNLWEQSQFEALIEIYHFILPSEDLFLGEDFERNLGLEGKKYVSVYYESGGGSGIESSYTGTSSFWADGGKILSMSGYDYFPILASRWSVASLDDVYGTESPGMISLGDNKQLQQEQIRKAEGIDKKLRPPMVGDAELRRSKVSLLPGGVTYVPERPGTSGFKPSFQIQDFSLRELLEDIQDIRARIEEAFYVNIFLALINDRRQQRSTAREVEEISQEKLSTLGAVLERFNTEVFDPLVDIVFSIAFRQGLIPRPPEILENEDLRVEYVSVMSQAQKLVGLSGIERFMGFVGQLAAANPSVVDKVDFDQAVDEYGEITSVPARIIISDEKVARMREDRNRQIAAGRQIEQVAAGAGVAKDLSQTDLGSDNALNRILRHARAGELARTTPR